MDNQRTITTRDQLQRKQVLRAFFIYLGAIAAVEFGIMLFIEELGFAWLSKAIFDTVTLVITLLPASYFFDSQASAHSCNRHCIKAKISFKRLHSQLLTPFLAWMSVERLPSGMMPLQNVRLQCHLLLLGGSYMSLLCRASTDLRRSKE